MISYGPINLNACLATALNLKTELFSVGHSALIIVIYQNSHIKGTSLALEMTPVI